MSEQKEFRKQLLETYSNYMLKDGMSPISLFSIEHDFGWDKIIETVFKKIKELFTPEEVQISQIKEKFGTLRFYIDYIDYKKIDDKKYDEINECIREAEILTSKTCECCGNPGTTRGGFWLKTVCDECDKDK